MDERLQLLVLVVGALVLVTLTIRAHLRFWRRRLSYAATYAHVERFPTRDGLPIELRRLPGLPASERSDQPPVLLVHGIAVNHRNNDPAPHRSLARHLSAEGRDVWLLTLRSALGPPSLFGDPRRSFQAMCEHDLPAAVRHLLAKTGAKQVDVCGFSMGGMVLYGALARTLPQACVRRVVILGAPGRVRALGPLKWARFLPRRFTPTLPLRMVIGSLAFAFRITPRPFKRFFYNPDNCCDQIARGMMVDLFEDLPGALGADFVRWAYNDGRVEVNGASVLQQMGVLRVPVRFFAGSADQIAPPDTVREAYDAWGSRMVGVDKDFTLLSTNNGARGDYGHGDLAFGEHAVREVYEPAARFLAAG